MTNENKKAVVFIYKTKNNTCIVTNYQPKNKELNHFLSFFDIWLSNGNRLQTKIRFECTKEFYELAKTNTFERVFDRLNAVVKFGSNL